MGLPAHWNAQYAKDRLSAQWYEWRHPDAPWMTREAIAVLDEWLQPEFTGIEWGSGRSTTWLAQRVAGLLTVEHDGAWYDKVRRRLESLQIQNVTLVRKDDSLLAYTEPGTALDDSLLDFAIVDGLHRDRCAEIAMAKLRPGGTLVIDDAHRYFPVPSRSPLSMGPGGTPLSDCWRRVWRQLETWERRWTSDGVRDTAMWTKP